MTGCIVQSVVRNPSQMGSQGGSHGLPWETFCINR